MNGGREDRTTAEATRPAAAAAAWTVARLLRTMKGRTNNPAILSLRDDHIETWSYHEVADTALGVAAGLRTAGFQPGAAVAIWAPNVPEWIVIALALGAAGALVVPIDDLVDKERARSVIADSGATWIFTTRARLSALQQMRSADAPRIYVLGPQSEPGSRVPSWRDLQSAHSSVEALAPKQPACLFYTSGTTGPPKAFVLTHTNIGANVEALASEGLLTARDRVLIPLPLHHAYPYIVGMLTCLEAGVAIVLPQSATGPHVVQAFRAAKVTAVIGVPRLYEALLNGLTSRVAAQGAVQRRLFSALLALSKCSQRYLGIAVGGWLFSPIRRQMAPDLRLLISGGAKLDEELSRNLEALGWQALAGYGLAETSSVFTGNVPRRKRLGSAGKPLADGQVRIADPDETGTGEIELRGRSVTDGYRHNLEANRSAFTADGWFRTGDLGYLDKDGFLFVTGRAKEVIVLGGGKKVNPEDLERRYAANPLVGEIAILESAGQLVGLVRPNPERLHEIGTLSVDHAVRSALAEIAQDLPPYERLAGFAIATRPLPRTRLGKLRRFLLPNLYEQALAGVTEAPPAGMSAEDRQFLAAPMAARVWEILLRRYGKRHPRLDAHLALDLGIDSLEWMALSLELEAKLGMALVEDDIAKIETVRDLISAAGGASTGRTRQDGGSPEHVARDRERWVRPIGPVLSSVGVMLHAVNACVMRLAFHLHAEGRDRLPPSGAVLLAPNHVSDLDAFAIAAALPPSHRRRTYWAGDVVRVFGNPVLRLLSRPLHLFPVDERTPARATETAKLVLSRGNVQVWFAEGWRSRDGRLQRFLPGIGTVLMASPAPVVPVYIYGAFRALPPRRHWPRRHPIRVLFGEPLAAETLASRGDGKNTAERIANALQREVRALAASIGEDI